MSIVRINAITVPEGRGADLEERFRTRAGEVDDRPGFEGFTLLRPTDGSDRYFVVTRWESTDAFEAWVGSDEFRRGHARTESDGPVASHSELLSFDVVLDSSV
jgi:heme oxygenase (mycobilin-producing)